VAEQNLSAYPHHQANRILYLEVLWFIKNYAPLLPPSTPVDISVLSRVYQDFRQWLAQYNDIEAALQAVQ